VDFAMLCLKNDLRIRENLIITFVCGLSISGEILDSLVREVTSRENS
jgi:hypothetical protein